MQLTMRTEQTVGEILDQSARDKWRHVKDTLNPVDIGAPGLPVAHLRKREWLNEPARLK